MGGLQPHCNSTVIPLFDHCWISQRADEDMVVETHGRICSVGLTRPLLCFVSAVECSQRSSDLNREKKEIKSEVSERYLLNAEEIAQVRIARANQQRTWCLRRWCRAKRIQRNALSLNLWSLKSTNTFANKNALSTAQIYKRARERRVHYRAATSAPYGASLDQLVTKTNTAVLRAALKTTNGAISCVLQRDFHPFLHNCLWCTRIPGITHLSAYIDTSPVVYRCISFVEQRVHRASIGLPIFLELALNSTTDRQRGYTTRTGPKQSHAARTGKESAREDLDEDAGGL